VSPADARLALLVAQARRDWGAVIALRDRAFSVDPMVGAPEMALVAISLHHAYQAFESLLERICRALALPVPVGERSHQELLDEAAIDIPGVRPALLPEDARRPWQELLRFRHFFRHAYSVELDPEELASNREQLARAISATQHRIVAVIDGLAGDGRAAPGRS